jgi:hypothetical protein
LKIHLAGDINSPNSISSRCRALFKHNKDSHEFKITNIKHDPVCIMIQTELLDDVKTACESKLENPDVCINMKSPEFWTLHEGAKNIGWISWGKGSAIPKEWVSKCSMMDKVLVTSEEDYASAIRANVECDVAIINEPIDIDIFGKISGEADIANVTVRENGIRIEDRKPAVLIQGKQSDATSIIEVLEVLCSQYTQNDLTIILRTYKNTMNTADDPAIIQMISQVRQRSNSKDGPRIVLLSNPLADEELAQVYNACSTSINISRTSGINQTVIQSALCGTVPITHTHNTSSSDIGSYMQIYDHTMIPVFDGNSSSDSWWASPNQLSLKDSIDYAMNKDISDQSKIELRKAHNPEKILEEIIS